MKGTKDQICATILSLENEIEALVDSSKAVGPYQKKALLNLINDRKKTLKAYKTELAKRSRLSKENGLTNGSLDPEATIANTAFDRKLRSLFL